MRTQLVLWTLLCGLAVGCSCSNHADADAQAWYEQGRALREADEPVQAMRVFLQAAHSGTGNEVLLGRVWSNMATMCRLAEEHQTAYRIYAVSAEHFLNGGDTLAYAYALNNMAWEQAVMRKKDSALALVDSAVQYYPRPPLTEKVIESRAAACLFAEEYDSVLYYTAPPANDYLLMLRAQAYSFLQLDDSATYYAKILLPRTKDLSSLDDIYYILTHNDAEADKETIRDLSSERADVHKAIEARHVQLAQAVQVLEQGDEHPDYIGLIVMALSIALVGLLLSFWTLYLNRKHRQWHSEQMKQQQRRLQEVTGNIQVLLDSPNLPAEVAWNDYPEFCRRTDKLFHGLCTRLQAYEMNEQDVRICFLVLLGKSHKEIADMLHCSSKSIGKLKDITARKLSVSGGSLREKLLEMAVNP